MRDGDDLVLSERERRVLAELEAMVASSDPDFGRRLGEGPGRGPVRRWWTGLVLLLLGAVTMLATFATSIWAAMVGVAMMAVGLGLVLPHLTTAARHAKSRAGDASEAG